VIIMTPMGRGQMRKKEEGEMLVCADQLKREETVESHGGNETNEVWVMKIKETRELLWKSLRIGHEIAMIKY
jgi:hypothetical protein